MIIKEVLLYPHTENEFSLEVGDRVEENTYITLIEATRVKDLDYIQVFLDGREDRASIIYAGVPYAVFYDLEEK